VVPFVSPAWARAGEMLKSHGRSQGTGSERLQALCEQTLGRDALSRAQRALELLPGDGSAPWVLAAMSAVRSMIHAQ
jgi:hypothetical protein